MNEQISSEQELHAFVDGAKPLMFEQQRGHDEGGMSGTGKVLEGIVFSDGTVAIHWTTELWSVTFFPNWRTFFDIHTGGHPSNQTIIAFPTVGLEWRQPMTKTRVLALMAQGYAVGGRGVRRHDGEPAGPSTVSVVEPSVPALPARLPGGTARSVVGAARATQRSRHIDGVTGSDTRASQWMR